MSLAYFDTSALVKNYVQEAGSNRVRKLLREHEFLSSAITPIELLSALGRRQRQGDINRSAYNSIIVRVKQDRLFWRLVESAPPVLAQAEEIVTNHSVRTLDAIHLASVLVIQESLGARVPFISADERQVAAARECQLDTVAAF